MAIGHFAFGFAATVALLVVLGLHRRIRRLGLVGVLGGTWALVPDAGVLFPGNPPLDHEPWVNVFWFHYLLDTHSVTDDLTGTVLLVGIMVVAVFAVFAVDLADRLSWGEGRRVLSYRRSRKK